MTDPNQLEVIYKKHYKRIFRYLRNHMREDSYQMVEDMTSDVMLKAWTNWDTLQDRSMEGPWIQRIAHNAMLDSFRRKKFVHPIDAESMIEWSETHSKQPSEHEYETLEIDLSDITPQASLRAESRYFVRKAIAELPEPQREVILMFYFQEYSQIEISEILGIAEGTVKSRASRARDVLARKLHDKILPGVFEKGLPIT